MYGFIQDGIFWCIFYKTYFFLGIERSPVIYLFSLIYTKSVFFDDSQPFYPMENRRQ